MLRIPSLKTIDAFVRSAETLNLTIAAEDLHLTQSAISQRIRQLEEQLGATLFHRQRRGLMLTEQGLALYQAIGPVLSDLQRIFCDEQIAKATRSVRLRVDQSLLSSRLSAHVAEMIDSCGDLCLEIAGADGGGLLGVDRNTIVIGPFESRPCHADFRSHTMASGRLMVVAAADAAAAVRESPASPGTISLFTTRRFQQDLEMVLSDAPADTPLADIRAIVVGNQMLALNAAGGSGGLALVDEVIAAPYVRSGAVDVLFESARRDMEHYDFQCHSDLLTLRGVRNLLDWTRNELSSTMRRPLAAGFDAGQRSH